MNGREVTINTLSWIIIKNQVVGHFFAFDEPEIETEDEELDYLATLYSRGWLHRAWFIDTAHGFRHAVHFDCICIVLNPCEAFIIGALLEKFDDMFDYSNFSPLFGEMVEVVVERIKRIKNNGIVWSILNEEIRTLNRHSIGRILISLAARGIFADWLDEAFLVSLVYSPAQSSF